MIKYLIHRPIAVTMILIALVVVGVIGTSRLPVSLMPNIDIPQISIQASVPGYSVQEIEKRVIAPLRSQLSRVPGVKNVHSDSRMDVGNIALKFSPESDIDLLFVEVNEKIDMAMGKMPKEVNRPKVIKASAMDIPAFYLDLSFRDEKEGTEASQRFSQLSEFARNVVCRRLEQLPPTAMVDMSGIVTSEITCTPDDYKMAAMGISIEQLQKALLDNDIQLSALTVQDGIFKYNVHFDNQILTLDDVKDIYVTHGGRIFQLKDLGNIEEHPAVRKNINRHNGKNCITLAVIKQNDARMADLKEAIEETVADLQKNYPEIEFDITRDQTELLAYSINNLEWNLLAAAFFTSVVLLYFMRKWRLALLVAMSIPLSLIITLLCFSLLHISINIISLSGLILGVGMIVDNSIIVIDNIIQKRRMGLAMDEAICQGTKKVFTPMLSSVLTTCSVFVPLIFAGGIAGALFYDQSMGIAIALFASLVVAMVALPVFYRVVSVKHQCKEMVQDMKGGHEFLFRCYSKGHDWMFAHVKSCLILFLLPIPGLFLMFAISEKSVMPEINYTDAIMYVDWNAGISVDENDRRISDVLTANRKGLETTTSMAGTQDFLLFHTKEITSSEALVYFKSKTQADFEESKEQLKSYILARYPQASVSFSPSGNLFDLIFSSGQPDLCLKLQDGAGHRVSVEQAKAFTDTLRHRIPELSVPTVMIENNLQLVADVEMMAMYGISFKQLSDKLRQMLGTNDVLRINQGAGSVPVIVGSFANGRKDILASTITSNNGVEIPLSMLIKERMNDGYKHLYGSAEGEFYPIELNGSSQQMREVQDFVKAYTHAHEDIKIMMDGDYFESREMIKGLLWILGIALFLLFFILAAQFESLVQPFIILSEVAIDVFIVLFFLWLMDVSLNVMSMIGMIVMVGIVINDSILKVDTINRHRREGGKLHDSIIKAGRERLLPIVMTSLTTIFSLLPFMAKGSLGADIQFPLSLTILIGMIVGTLVSIYYVPLIYYVIYRKR